VNIFVTSDCPVECAKNLDDKRVVKMVLETAQMLCTALNLANQKTPYKSTHANHPSNMWARSTRSNWVWLWNHGVALCSEYTSRYGRVHKCESVIKSLFKLKAFIPEGPLTPFANCAANKSIGVDYKHVKNTTLAYQLYLNDRWKADKRKPTWYGISSVYYS
jgi:hypothetical protein